MHIFLLDLTPKRLRLITFAFSILIDPDIVIVPEEIPIARFEYDIGSVFVDGFVMAVDVVFDFPAQWTVGMQGSPVFVDGPRVRFGLVFV